MYRPIAPVKPYEPLAASALLVAAGWRREKGVREKGVSSNQVARTCGLGTRLFMRNWAFHFQIRVRPRVARRARSLPSQIGRTKTAGADVASR